MLHPLFAGLPEQDKALLSQRSRLITLRRGDVLIEAGQTSYEVYLVINGRLRVDRGEGIGTKSTTGFLNARDMYLETATGSCYVLSHSLVASLNSTVQATPLPLLQALARRYPAVLLHAIDLIHERAQNLRTQLRRMTTQESEVVIGRALYELADEQRDGRRVLNKRVTQQELAAYVGMSREQVNKKMRELESKGLLRRVEDGYELDSAFAQTHMLAEKADSTPQA